MPKNMDTPIVASQPSSQPPVVWREPVMILENNISQSCHILALTKTVCHTKLQKYPYLIDRVF